MEAVDRQLIEMLGAPPRVVCLPTAAGQEGAGRIAYWSDLGVEHFTRLGAQVEALPIIDRASACDQGWVERIRQANFVYLSGGKPGYLYATLANTPTWEAIMAVERAGGVLAGCSAGAMILGERLPGFPHWQAAFGLLPGAVVIPHFDELSPSLLGLTQRALPRGKFLVGIEGDTALVVEPDRHIALGRQGVTIFTPGERRERGERSRRYTHGQLIDWPLITPSR
jgi:cyanophycinase-like exopeptidase